MGGGREGGRGEGGSEGGREGGSEGGKEGGREGRDNNYVASCPHLDHKPLANLKTRMYRYRNYFCMFH